MKFAGSSSGSSVAPPLRIAILNSPPVPTTMPCPFSINEVVDAMVHDKKNVGGSIRWCLITGTGSAAYDIAAPKELVTESLGEIVARAFPLRFAVAGQAQPWADGAEPRDEASRISVRVRTFVGPELEALATIRPSTVHKS